jgi:hypothetical protein
MYESVVLSHQANLQIVGFLFVCLFVWKIDVVKIIIKKTPISIGLHRRLAVCVCVCECVL